MSTLERLRLSVLSEMIERAAAVAGDRSPTALLAEAFALGTAHLQRLAVGDDGIQPTNGLAQGSAAWEEQVATRASYDLLRHRALALTEQHNALDRTIGELTTESLELHDQLWEWHTRAGRLKVALGRATTIRDRPEAAPTIGSGGGGKRRRATLERLLGGLERREVELELAAEAVERARDLIRVRGWDEQWGDDAYLLVLAHGLAVLELPAQPSGPDSALAPPPSLEAVRYRVFELAEAIRILEIRHTAFRIDNQGMRLRLAQLQREVAELETALAEQGEPPTEQPDRGFLGRLFRRPGR